MQNVRSNRIRNLMYDVLTDDLRLPDSKIRLISGSLIKDYFAEEDVHTKANIITILSRYFEDMKLKSVPKPLINEMLLNNDEAYQLFSLLARHSPSLFANTIVRLMCNQSITLENQKLLAGIFERLVLTENVQLEYTDFSRLLHSVVEQFAVSSLYNNLSSEQQLIVNEYLVARADIIARFFKFYRIMDNDLQALHFMLHQFAERGAYSPLINILTSKGICARERAHLLINLYEYFSMVEKTGVHNEEVSRYKVRIFNYMYEEMNLIPFVSTLKDRIRKK